MADTMLAVKQANSEVFLGTGDSGELKIVETPTGPMVLINGAEVPLLNEEFRLSVVQNASVKNDKALAKHVGQVRLHLGEDAEGDDFFDEIFLVPIAIQGYSYAKFGKYDGKASTPLCSSSNGWYPNVRNDMTPVSKQCARYEISNGVVKTIPLCPACSWGADGEPPACKQSVSVSFLTVPGCIPVTMSLHGVGLSAFNGLLRKLNKARNVARIKKRDLTRFAVRLTAEDNGQYTSPKFEFVEVPESLGPIPEYTSVARHFRNTLFNVNAAENVAGSVEETQVEGSTFDV